MTSRSYGLLLPHFGTHASRDAILEAAQEIEQLGFVSVWARDHVVYRPHEHEDANRTHLDPFVTLSAVAAVTSRVVLATGTLIPHRHPIHAAGLIGSLDMIAGPGRILIGIGMGNDPAEFEAVGMGDWDRRAVVEEYATVLRAVLDASRTDFNGRYYHFSDVLVRPIPSRKVPLWYGGPSLAALRRAVDYCDGWLAGRTPRWALAGRIDRIKALAEARQVPMPRVGITCYVSPGKTVERGLRAVNVPALATAIEKSYGQAPSGSVSSYADLDGAAIAGPPEHIVGEVRRYEDLGVEHFVFDLRPQFARWRELVPLIGESVLPQLRRSG